MATQIKWSYPSFRAEKQGLVSPPGHREGGTEPGFDPRPDAQGCRAVHLKGSDG